MLRTKDVLLSWLAPLGLLAAGCQHESAGSALADTHAPNASSTPAPLDTPAPPDTTEAARGAACSADGDCHTVDWYCDACQCLALAAGASPPKCTGATVQCLAAPCRGQHAVCRAGRCQLQSDSAM